MALKTRIANRSSNRSSCEIFLISTDHREACSVLMRSRRRLRVSKITCGAGSENHPHAAERILDFVMNRDEERN